MDRFLLIAFLALVILAALPSGGNVPLAWTTNAFLTGVLVIMVAMQNLVLKRPAAVPFRWITLPALLFALVCLWAMIQSLGVTPAALHNPLWSAASDAFGEPLRGAISVNPFNTRVSLMRLLSYAAIFWLALQFGRDRSQAVIMIQAIGLGIAGYAVYGLLLWSLGSEFIPWYGKRAGTGEVTSTFINRNNFATLAGMGSVLFFGLVMHRMGQIIRAGHGERFKYRLERMLAALAGVEGLYLIGALMTLGSLFLSRSRAGLFATLSALGVLIVLSLWGMRSGRGGRTGHDRHGGHGGGMGKSGLALMALVMVGGIIASFNMSGERIATRLVRSELTIEGRMAVYPRLVEAIRDYPLTGTGYGTFEDMFPLYRDETVSPFGHWDKAHNSYLELMMELGLPASLMLFLAIGLLVWRCLRGGVTRHRDRYIPLIALAASVLVALHSLVDFSLQIPGVAIPYAALLGVGVAQSWSSRRR